MKHYGDITKINGHNVPLVDIVCGGSPCQDLSVAGKRQGLQGERSGLFMEQIRIVKEMRDESAKQLRSRGTAFDLRCVQPRYMVWENVPGAFSSNKGEDFRAVLEEICRVADQAAAVPMPKEGRWSTSGCIMGDNWSVAWRVHDAQFWGVPQRRKRIALVADFGGQSAPEILFERKGLSRDIEESAEQREGITGTVEGCINKAISFQERAGKPGGGKGILIQNERTGALSTFNNQSVFCIQGNCIDRSDTAGCNGRGWRENQSYTLNTIDRPAVCAIENHPADSRVRLAKDNKVQTLSSRMGTGGGNVPMIMEKIHQKIITTSHGGFMLNADDNDIAHTLQATDYKDPQLVSYGLDRASFNQGKNALYDFSIEKEKIATQVAKGPGAVCTNIVRRITPMECERLQGYPDGWTDIGDWTDSKGKTHKGESDSPRYKALGNSIALPFWQWMAARMVAQYDRATSMASLFDGIGGFPLVFSRCGCEPVWASEIEEFPIAVTKIRFPEEVSE